MATTAKRKINRTAPLTIEEAKEKRIVAESKKCRYCMNVKNQNRFYVSQDFLDSDGRMSICIDCCGYLFNYYYSVHSRIDIAIYELCRCVNVRYDSKAYSSLMTSLEKNSMQATISAINGEISEDMSENTIDQIAVDTKTSIFGKYYNILKKIYQNSPDMDLTFDVYKNDRPEGYEDKTTDKAVVEAIDDAYEKKMNSLEKKWGKQEGDDYAFLESEYNSWAKTKDTDEKGVDLLIREVCLHQLKMRKMRENGEDIKKDDIEILTRLMDKCSISPDKLKENNSNRSLAAFGVWLKDVETISPAEWVENKKLFKDVEGIDEYVNRTFDRAVKNYIGQQRDFRVVADKMEKEAQDFNPDEISGLVVSEEDGAEDGE